MRLEEFNELKEQIPDFEEKYCSWVYADELIMTDESQQRAGGHQRQSVPDFAASISAEGQKAPISICHISEGKKVDDGNTRTLAYLRIQEETGERQVARVSDYFEKHVFGASEKKLQRYNSNYDPTPSNGNTLACFEKLTSELYEEGYFDSNLSMCYKGNEVEFREGVLGIIAEKVKHRWSQKQVEGAVDKVLGSNGHTPNFLSWDTNSVLRKVCDGLDGWTLEGVRGNKLAGHKSNGIRIWACGDTGQIEKDQLSYAYRGKRTSPENKHILVLYVKNIHGKSEAWIIDQRQVLLKAVEKWRYDPSGYLLWDEVYFAPQIKRTDKFNKLTLANNPREVEQRS